MGAHFWGEFFGTMLLILLGNGVVANVLLTQSKGNGGGWIVISAGWAFAVLSGVMVAVAIGSNGHINPAVTLAFAYSSGVWTTVPSYIVAQFAGGFVGAVLVWIAYLPHWAKTEDPGLKFACFSTSPAIRDTKSNFATEVIATFVLLFVVIAIFSKAVGASGVLAPLMVAFLVWGIGLSLGGPTGYAINPARDLAPRVAHALLPIAGKGSSDWGYSWVPVVGPITGALLAIVVAWVAGLG
ncbi:MIP/aquaporin family protein [Hyphomicrobium sp.]|uniref:MIP/aquaporin family protein n=1 Tax=Hyphomicrobium sp. TaxID=82 RepID=UPI0025BC6451|nr:MIP/aquaporin family protein [Hyphomicrobium sp.]MCC7254100.1 aquaporin family protein [Hyphomicrobium sp.]